MIQRVSKQLTCLITISLCIKFIFTQSGCNISYCQQCDALNLNCVQCQADFILNPSSNICQSKCLFGTYYDFNLSLCIPICNNGQAQDETHRVCIQTQACHSLQSPNGVVYKYNKIAQIYKNYVIVSGSEDNTNNSNTLSLFSYDLITSTVLSHLGYLSQNGGPIIFFHISTNSQNQDIIYSFSRTSITAFELNSGIQINSYTLLNGFFVDSSTYYIDDNYLIMFYYRNQQFAVLQYQQQLSNNCSSQQCLITFQRVHINSILGFILDSQGNIISYAPDGMIIQWNIQNQTYQTILSNQNYEISSLCLSIIQQNQQIFSFSTQYDSKNQVYINANNKVNSFQLGFSSPILEILDYNQLIQSSSNNMNSYSIIIIRSSSQLMLVKFQFGQQITTQNLLSVSINPIITKAIKGYFYLVLQANGIYSINQSNSQYSLQLINSIQLSSFNYINDVELFKLNNTQSGFSFLLVAKQLKIIIPQAQSTLDPYSGIEQQVSPSYQQHSKGVNGVWYDSTLNVYLSFSQDGSFAVWDIFMYNIFKIKPLFFVFPSWCQQYQTCSTSIVNAQLFQTGIFICQYSNSVIISWNYNRIQASVRQTYIMQNKNDIIQQFKMFGLKYLYFCNTNEIRIYDFSQSETNIINSNYQFIQDYLIKIELGYDNNNLYLIELARQQSGQYILRLRKTDQYFSQINLINLPRIAVDLQFHQQNQRVFVNVEQDLIWAFYFPSLWRINLYSVGNTNYWLHTFCYSWQTDQLITINQNGQMVLWKFGYDFYNYYVVLLQQIPLPRSNYQLLEQKQILASNQGFVMFQNSESQFIDNQVIGMDYTYLRPCFVYPFKNEINAIYISNDNTLFVSFTSGDIYFTQYSCSIQQYAYGQANTTQIIHNQYLRKSYIFQKNQMIVIDYYNQNVNYINYPHQLNTYQALEDTQNNFLVTYSQEQSTNLYKYSMQTNTYVQFLNGHLYSVNYAFLDINNDILISFSSDPRDLNLILWQYSNTIQIIQFNDIKKHISTNSQIQIVNLLLYKQQNLVYALLSDGMMFYFNYLQKTVNFLQIDPGAINFWIDETYGNVFILLNSNALQVRTIKTFQIIAQVIFTQNVNNPQNIMYSNNYVFVFLSNAHSIVSRTKFNQIQQIDCSFQPCLDACFSEKLDQLFLYSSYQSDSIYVYQAISGQLLYSIYGVSDLNKGQISSVIIDDDDYLLIIGKLDNFISVFFNYYTKQEVGYFYDAIVQYKYSKFIQELNVFFLCQFYNFEPFSIQNMITSTFQTQSFYILKWIDYYTDSKNNIYYVDGSNTMRKYNQQSNQISIITQLQNYRQIYYYNATVFILYYDQLVKLNDDLSQIQGINPYKMNGSDILGIFGGYIYIQTFQFQILKLDIINLSLNYTIQNNALIQKYSFVTQKQELLYSTQANGFFLYNYNTNKLLNQFPDSWGYYTFNYDLDFQFIVLGSIYKIDFYPYQSTNPGLNTTKTVSLDFTKKIDYFWMDFGYLKFYVIYKADRKIDIYQMIVQYQQSNVQINYIYYIPTFPNPQSVQLDIQGNFTRVMLPWSINYYRRDNHTLLISIQDQAYIQSIRQFINDPNFPEIVFLPQNNFLSVVYQNQTTYKMKLLIKLTLTYPKILNIQISKSSTQYGIKLLLLASGDIWNYNFNLDINQNQVSVTNQQQCSLFINDPSIGFQVENQLLQLQNYFQDTGNIQSQPNVVIQGAEFLYYSDIMKQLKALVVYQGDQTDSLLMLYNDSFSKNSLYTMNIKNTFITISKQSTTITLNPQTNEIKLYNVTISQEQPNTPSQASILITQVENALLQNIIIQNITISNSTTFLNFSSTTNLNIQNLMISNVQMHIDSTLISFQQITSLQINNLTLQNVTILTDNSNNSSALTNQIFIFDKVKQLQLLNTTFNSIKSQIRSVMFQLIQNLECTFQGLSVDQLYNVQFIKNQNYGSSTQLTYIDTQDTFYITNSKFSNYFSDLDSLICYQGSLLNVQNTTFQNSSCKSCTGTVLQIQSSSQILINSSTFKNNSGYNGGAISISNCQNSNIQINQSNFTSNYAGFSGGAIYLMDSEIQMQQTTFTSNIAFIGGAIRYLIYKPQIFYSSLLNSQVQFIQNKAYIHSQNWGSYPQSVNVIFINSTSSRVLTTKAYSSKRNTNQNSHFALANIQSGGFLNLSFQLLDEEGNIVAYDYQNCLNTMYTQDLCNEIQKININLISQDDSKMRVLGSYITKYSEFITQNKTFQINGIQLVANPLSNQTMLVYVSGIVTYSSNIQISNPYYAQVQVEFRDCLIGEIIEQSNDFYECTPCPFGTYSIQKPEINQAQKCIRCPQEAQFCQENQMTLSKGYWKSSNSSDIIYPCTQSNNCEGNQTTNYCSIGHTGPLCQFCDEEGTIWGGQYQYTGQNKCDLCSGQSLTKSLGIAFLICLGLIIYCVINIFTMMASGEKISQSYYLRRMKLASVSNSCYKQIQINMSIKSLTNFIQMLKIMSTQTLQLPVSITIVPDLFGSPSSSYVFSTSCFLANLQTDTLKPLFIKLISISISPFIYIASLIVIYLFINPFLRGFQFSKSKIISIIVFVFWFLKPSVVYTLIQGISCVNFDGQKYIQLDYTYECYTETHIKFLYYLLIPSLIFYIIIVPGIILKKISSNKNNLDYATVRQRYGYIYQDYSKVGFYWEFIRFAVQLIIIFYQNLEIISSNTRCLLIMGVLIVYYIALSKIKPFMMKKYQRVEEQSTVVLIFISVLNLALDNNSSSTQTFAFQVILYVPYYVNIGYLIYLIITISLIPQLSNCYRIFLGVISQQNKQTNNSQQMHNQMIKQRVQYLWKQAYLKLFIYQMYQSKKIDQINEALVILDKQSSITQKKFSINLVKNISSKTKINSLQPRPSNIKSKFGTVFEIQNSTSRKESIFSNDSYILRQPQDTIESGMHNLISRPTETLESELKNKRNPYKQKTPKGKPEE
ncbi:transmembrane protein, putative (macronuclear) [Tetrahymena thermophila SB210]|uniref:Transmembrane protein, putative n=1 Tax=Tetrahymena thermophila (strain SB210) TaxID=312017 RepID=W7X5H8_TETTS|nr:transmembrane protein, putative [Tetrahymena thermophila SB210]EWS71613.1 transmembrane protein, putative [Tetrahymena thermophila SB210]|eukprot:XP_012655858.1 transmembrane protein, putative [Tetrahymena thermophila SB210]